MHLAEAWRRIAERHSDRTAVFAEGHLSSFGQLWERISQAGIALLDHGLEPGDRVAIISDGFSRDYLEAEQGVMVAGLVRVPLDPALRDQDWLVQLRHAGADVILCDRRYRTRADGVASMLNDVKVFELGGTWLTGVPGTGKGVSGGRPGDLASLAFTGGTTGEPKAVALEHRNLAAVVREVNTSRRLEPDDLFLNVRPMWPISGIIVMIHLLAGSPVILESKFDAATFSENVLRWQPTVTSLVPTMLVRLLDRAAPDPSAFRSLRTIDIGAASLPTERWKDAVHRFGPIFGTVYGLTEAPWTCYRAPGELIDEYGRIVPSVGRPVGNHRVTIVPVELGGEPADDGQIVIEGDHVMHGYWRDPHRTAAVIQGRRFHTGDLGSLDANGRLHVTGRRDEVIRTGGRSVQPTEVEAVLRDHSSVADAVILGIPDDEWGEIVVAVVVLRDGAQEDETSLLDYCRSRLASHKRPRRVTLVDRFPRSHYGKVKRTELRRLLARQMPVLDSRGEEG